MKKTLIFCFLMVAASFIYAVPIGLFGGGDRGGDHLIQLYMVKLDGTFFMRGKFGGGDGRGDIQLLLPYKQLNGSSGGEGATQLNFIQQPGHIATNAKFGVSAVITDPIGRRIIDPAASVNLARTGGTGTLEGTLTKTTGNGLASFDGLSLNAGGAYQLTANATGLTQATSSTFYVYDKAFTNNNGLGNNDWANNTNWSGGILPEAGDVALIMAEATLAGEQTVNQLIISNISGSKLTLTPTAQLTVSEAIINSQSSSELALQSNVTQTSSLLHSSENVPATVQITFPGNINDWHMISSPVDLQAAIGTFNQDGHLFAWSEPAQSWVKAGLSQGYPKWNDVNNSHDNFIPVKGYLIKYNVEFPNRIFTGNLNQGSFSFSLELGSKMKDPYHGFQLVGNPYPSSIDWKAEEGWGRSNLEEVTENENNYAYWIWNNDAGNYGTFISNGADESGTLGATRYLAPFQAFWVKAIAANSFTMNNQIRLHSSVTQLKDAKIDNNLVLTVSGNANSYSDQTIISLGNANDTGGANKMFSLYATAPSLYTVKSELNYSINILSDSPKQPVMLAFKAGAVDNFTIEAKGGLLSKNVVLEDTQTGIKTALSIDSSYSFNAATTDNPNRFLLYFDTTTDARNSLSTRLLATYNNGLLNIMNPFSGISRADLYDVNGRLISTYQLNFAGKQQLQIEIRHTGVYLIKISNSKETMTGKFLVIN